METATIPAALYSIVQNYNRQNPYDVLQIFGEESGLFVIGFYYYKQPSPEQLTRLKNLFSYVEVVDMSDEDCGTLYPIFVKLK